MLGRTLQADGLVALHDRIESEKLSSMGVVEAQLKSEEAGLGKNAKDEKKAVIWRNPFPSLISFFKVKKWPFRLHLPTGLIKVVRLSPPRGR